MGTPQMSSLIW